MLADQQWFSMLDLASGYWQVGLTDRAKEKSAFATQPGLFQFKVMPFRLCNAPATFESLMSQVLRGLQWERCLVYIDNILDRLTLPWIIFAQCWIELPSMAYSSNRPSVLSSDPVYHSWDTWLVGTVLNATRKR